MYSKDGIGAIIELNEGKANGRNEQKDDQCDVE